MPKSTATKVRRRSPGEGAVFEYPKGSGRYRGAITWTDPDGTRHKRVVSGRTSADARAKLDDIRRDLRLGTIAPSGRPDTVEDYLTGWIDKYRLTVRPSTWQSAAMHVRAYLIPALGRLPLARLSPADVEDAMARFLAHGMPERPARRGPGRQNAGGVSPQTVRHIRSTLRRALADAVRDGKAIRNVAAQARPPRLPHRPITYLTTRDMTRLLDATREDPDGPLYAVAATTGLRLGELLGLAWPDVEGGRLRVRRSLAADCRWRLGTGRDQDGAITAHDPAARPRPGGTGIPAHPPALRPARGRHGMAGPRRAGFHRCRRASAQSRDRVPRLPQGSRPGRRARGPLP